MAMEELSSLFCSEVNVEEMKQRIVYLTYELQAVRLQKEEEVRKNRESMESAKHLLQMLQAAYRERDEAKDQLHMLLDSVNSAVSLPILSPPESPLGRYGRGDDVNNSSGVTESNSFSDTTTTNPSQGDSLYDVISPSVPPNSLRAVDVDPETHIIYSIAKGKALPQKGKLLRAVMEAGPLLQTLMVAGPLPSWRNPPPSQPLQVPPVGIAGFNNQAGVPHSVNMLPAGCGSSEFHTNPVLNFAAGGLNNARGMVSRAGVGFGCRMIPTPKRQRIQ